ncbi:MAG: EF-hand domain-containing protein [Alphaproteobacteria bacterium]
MSQPQRSTRKTRFAAASAAFLSAAFLLPAAANAQNAESIEAETIEVETIKAEKPPTLRPSTRGPITVIRPASLWFVTLDTNGDYKISRRELEAGLTKTFDQEDSNQDGRLSLFDIENWRKHALGSPDAAPHALQFDDNYDSTITRKEFNATLTHLFDRADANEDNVIEFSELITVTERPGRRKQAEDNSSQRREKSQQRRPRGR